MKSFKNDIAPVIFYFDIFSTEIFEVPVMPVPIRIDKIINGDVSSFILPNMDELHQLFNKLDYYIDFDSVFFIGLKNFVKYAKKRYHKFSFRPFDISKVFTWFEKSKYIDARIPSLTEDFTFLISEFIQMYSNLEKKRIISEDQINNAELVQYCERVIDYFKKKLDQNLIYIEKNNEIIAKKIYKEKKGKYYPEMIPIDVNYIQKNKIKTKIFIPYLIYDDLIDCFTYNLKILEEKSQSPCDLNIWSKNNVIVTSDVKGKSKLKDFSLQKFDIGSII